MVLTARRGDRLERLADEIRLRYGVETFTVVADLADPGACDQLLSEINAQGRVVDALINNAGYGVPGRYSATSWGDQRAFLQVLLVAVCELTHKLLPGMIERRFGRIVNVASLAGLVPGLGGPDALAPGGTKSPSWCGSRKASHLETLDKGVHVSALCPGFTYSEFHDVTQSRDQISLRGTPAWLWPDGAGRSRRRRLRGGRKPIAAPPACRARRTSAIAVHRPSWSLTTGPWRCWRGVQPHPPHVGGLGRLRSLSVIAWL